MPIDKKNKKNGNIAMLILGLLTDGDKYGYQMIEELDKRSNHTFQLKAGTFISASALA